LRIKWLNVTLPDIGVYAKNHLIVVVSFVQPQVIDSQTCHAARISIETGALKEVAELATEMIWIAFMSTMI
jgi:hypothetical protein